MENERGEKNDRKTLNNSITIVAKQITQSSCYHTDLSLLWTIRVISALIGSMNALTSSAEQQQHVEKGKQKK